MRGVLIFIFLASLVLCQQPESSTGKHEERVQRRKKFQQEIYDCILKEDISTELKTKLQENKDEDLRHTLHLFLNKLDTKDREVIRKCRRKKKKKMRDLFKGRKYDGFMNRTHYRHHPFLHERNQRPPMFSGAEKKPEAEAVKSATKSAK